MLHFALLLLITFASGALYGYALRRLTDPRTDPARVPRPVALAVPGSLLLCLSGFALLVFLKVPYTFNLGPLGGAFGAVAVADLLRFDRLFDARLKRYNAHLRCCASLLHGPIALSIGIALFELLLATGIFTTPATQILLAAAVGALVQAVEAVVLPYFVTVSDKAERTRLRRGAWRMAVLRANMLFLCTAAVYSGLFLPAQLVNDNLPTIVAVIIVGVVFLSIFLTSRWDSTFLTDEAVAHETTNPLLQESLLVSEIPSVNTPAVVPFADVTKAATDTSPAVQWFGIRKG